MHLDCVEPALISAASIDGRSIQARSRRLPIGVTVQSRERNSVALSPDAGEERLDQLEIADGDRVEHQAVLPLVEADAVDVIERAALGGADVMQDGARGRCRRRAVRQAEAFQREHAEMIFDLRNGVVGREDPVVQRSLGPTGVLE